VAVPADARVQHHHPLEGRPERAMVARVSCSRGRLTDDHAHSDHRRHFDRIRPLCSRRTGRDNYKSLMTAIQETTSGKWELVDGEGGTMSAVPNARSLVILAPQQMHRQVEGLLTALRKAKRLQRIPSIAITSGDVMSNSAPVR
jgi:hypothetical protein